MSATVGAVEVARARPVDVVVNLIRRNVWTIGLIGLLALLLIFTKMIQPRYAAPQVQGLAISVLPLALAAVAQAIVVIGGGIDLSIGSMMALTSVVSAVLMKDQSPEYAVLVVVGTLVLGLVLGAINGGVVVISRVPDIVVTLAMSFVWAGFALLVTPRPGGAAAPWLKELVLGSIAGAWIPAGLPRDLAVWVPKALVLLLVIVALVWIPVSRSRIGLSIFAIGSNQLAAFRSGVPVGRTKFVAYILTGLFSALAGLSLTASTGVGTPVPGPYTLLSVAAVVLGGVSLAGGRGGVFGPIVGVVVLQLIRTDLTFLNVNTNLAVVAQGIVLIGVVMFGTFFQFRRSRA
jgi:ribose transport system permease protein